MPLTKATDGIGEQRAEQPGDVVGAEPDEIGVDEDDQITGRRRHRLPQRLALARPVAELREDLVLADDLGAGACSLSGRGIGGSGVDDQDLVDQADLGEPAAAR